MGSPNGQGDRFRHLHVRKLAPGRYQLDGGYVVTRHQHEHWIVTLWQDAAEDFATVGPVLGSYADALRYVERLLLGAG